MVYLSINNVKCLGFRRLVVKTASGPIFEARTSLRSRKFGWFFINYIKYRQKNFGGNFDAIFFVPP